MLSPHSDSPKLPELPEILHERISVPVSTVPLVKSSYSPVNRVLGDTYLSGTASQLRSQK